MLPYVLAGIAAVVLLLIIVIAIQPAAFSITRSATIAAPPAVVYDNVADFQKWRAWSPWEGMDPNLQRNYSGSPSGPGAMYHWVGNKQVGEGRMTITDTQPGERIAIKLEFIKPFVATNQAVFTFKPEGDVTNVTWTMTGERTFMMKGFGLLMNFDKMIGGQFDQGLAKLKSVTETVKA